MLSSEQLEFLSFRVYRWWLKIARPCADVVKRTDVSQGRAISGRRRVASCVTPITGSFTAFTCGCILRMRINVLHTCTMFCSVALGVCAVYCVELLSVVYCTLKHCSTRFPTKPRPLFSVDRRA